MLREELLGGDGEGHPVVDSREAVPLVGRDDVLDVAAEVAERDDDLVRFGLLHARIVRSLHDEERRLDLLRGEERRLALETLGVLGLRRDRRRAR